MDRLKIDFVYRATVECIGRIVIVHCVLLAKGKLQSCRRCGDRYDGLTERTREVSIYSCVGFRSPGGGWCTNDLGAVICFVCAFIVFNIFRCHVQTRDLRGKVLRMGSVRWRTVKEFKPSAGRVLAAPCPCPIGNLDTIPWTWGQLSGCVVRQAFFLVILSCRWKSRMDCFSITVI